MHIHIYIYIYIYLRNASLGAPPHEIVAALLRDGHRDHVRLAGVEEHHLAAAAAETRTGNAARQTTAQEHH